MITVNEIKQRLIQEIESVAVHLLPEGKREGRNYRCGSVNGEKGQSFSLSIEGANRGVWKDFSSDDGGDLLDLWVQARNLSFVEALGEAKKFLNISETPPLVGAFQHRKKKVSVQKPICKVPADKPLEWLKSRNIQDSAITAFKVGAHGNTLVFPFLSPDGSIELVKYRDLDSEEGGKKKIWSNKDPEYHLWGWQAIPNNARTVVICEGEIDALSWYGQGHASLSIPQGAGSGDKQEIWINNDYDRLLRFETIYISMDMDEAGQTAIEPIIKRLGRERCRVVNLGKYKDANEVDMDGESLDYYLKTSKTCDPDQLVNLSDRKAEIIREFSDEESYAGIKLPWKLLQQKDCFVSLRMDEVSIWAGINGHGKTVSLSQVTVDAISQGYATCTASMEMPVKKLGKKMVQQIVGSENPSPMNIDKCFEFLDGKAYVYEAFGRTDANKMMEVFAYAAKRYDVKLFVIDSLSKCGFDEDDYSGQKNFIDDVTEFVKKFSVHVVIVMHVRKGRNELETPSKMDVKGTGAVTDMVSNVFLWWRNKAEGDRDYDALFICAKQRETGIEPTMGLRFNPLSVSFYREEEQGSIKQYLF